MDVKVYKGNLSPSPRLHYICEEYESHWKCLYNKTRCNVSTVSFRYDGNRKWEYATYEISAPNSKPTDMRIFGKWSSEPHDEATINVCDLQLQGTLAVTITEYHSTYDPYSSLPAIAAKPGSTELKMSPDHCDGTIVIKGMKIGINKRFLAMHSPYFNKLFFGEFVEKNKNEIELKGFDYAKFVEFLRVILPERKYVTKDTVNDILRMACFFDCESARRDCVLFLHGEQTMTHFEKLQLADQYRLIELEDVILGHLNKTDAIAACEYGNKKYSERLMARLAMKIGEA